jgi:hypothetical protein
MKISTELATTITVELTAQDILEYVVEKNIIPKGWQFYSVKVDGKGISEGATLIIRHTDIKRP